MPLKWHKAKFVWWLTPSLCQGKDTNLLAVRFANASSSHRVSRCDKKIGHPFGCPIFLWSGLRGSNPPPSPWQGDALPNELNPHICGASGRNRTNDTGIFSPLLYQLSYRGIFAPLLRDRMFSKFTTWILFVATRRGLEPLTSSVTG